MPVTCCTLGTTLACRSVTLSAPMRTTTSYGPVTYSDDKHAREGGELLGDDLGAAHLGLDQHESLDHPFPSVSLHRILAAGTKRTAGPAGVQASEGGGMATDEPAETLAGVGEFAVIDRLVAGRDQPATVVLGPGDDAAVVVAGDGRTRGVHRHAGGRAALPAGLVHAA